MGLWDRIRRLFRTRRKESRAAEERKRVYIPKDDNELSETRVLTPEEVNELEQIMKDDNSSDWDDV